MKFSIDKLIVIDLGTGSYLDEHKGFEIFNFVRNSIDGKFYGYCPPYDNVDILNFGVNKNDKYIDEILVVYVGKCDNSNDRYIQAFCPNARIYSKPQSGENLNRKISDKDGSEKCATYTIKSDSLIDVSNQFSKFIINIASYNSYMFRKQRFYGNKYPELSAKILKYCEDIFLGKEIDDDFTIQQDINELRDVDIKAVAKSSSAEPRFIDGIKGKSVIKDSRMPKIVLSKANYLCQFDEKHITFKKENGLSYMEGHHLIPCSYFNGKNYWDRYKVNIDCVENIVCLCPTCHRAIHFGNKEVKQEIIKVLFNKQKKLLKGVRINITLDELFELYKI